MIVNCDAMGIARPTDGAPAGLRPVARQDPRAPHGHAERAPTRARTPPSSWPGRSRTSTWTPAAGPTPASTSRSAAAASCSRAATTAWSSPRVGRRQVEGAHCTGQNVVALGIENEGTYSAVDPPAEAVGPAARPVRVPLPAVPHRADRRSTGTATSRTPPVPGTASTPRCPGCGPRSPGCSGSGRARTRARRLAAAADRRPRGPGARRPVPAPRRRGRRGRAGRALHPRAGRRRARVPDGARLPRRRDAARSPA